MIVQSLLDSGREVSIPGVAAPETSFEDVRAPVALALEQEKRVTEQIGRLVEIAREERDHVGEQLLGWFLGEQREEVATASALLAVVDRAGVDNVLLVEAYLSQAGLAAAEPGGAAPPRQVARSNTQDRYRLGRSC
jgi:bacterioferritin B